MLLQVGGASVGVATGGWGYCGCCYRWVGLLWVLLQVGGAIVGVAAGGWGYCGCCCRWVGLLWVLLQLGVVNSGWG